jgi:DNA replication protein DnaC
MDNSFSNHYFRKFCFCNKMQEHIRHLKEMNELEDKLLSLDNRLLVQRKKSEKLLYESGIGKRFLNASFDNFDRKWEPDAYEVAKQYVESFPMSDGKGLIFTGGVGTGKTHLAAAICREVISRYSTTVEFVSYVQLLADIRAAFSDNRNIGEIEEKMMKTGLLVIDDLGKEKQSQFSNEMLYKVVNERYKNELPMIITTNWPLKSLSERLDYAVFSRLIGTCKVVETSGNDYRMRNYLC